MTSDNASDILGDGAFRYDPTTKTLTVRDANLENDAMLGTGISNRSVYDLTINLEGNSVFKTRMPSIYSEESFNITGTGTLTCISESSALYFGGGRMTCTINGPTIDFTARAHAIEDNANNTSLYIQGESTHITLQPGTFYETVNNLGYMGVDGGLEISPSGIWFDSSLSSLTNDGSNA